MSTKSISARLAATQLLHAVLFDKRQMSFVLSSDDSPLARLGASDRARAQSLATGVLRHLGRIDAVLATFLKKPPQPKAQQALRVATYELLVANTPAHGAVNACVEIVRGSRKAGHLAGLANAVARRVANEGPALWQEQTPQPLPNWLANPIRKSYGADALLAIEAAHEAGAAVDLTLRDPEKTEHFAEKLNAIRLPTGSLRLRARAQITALEGFEQGDWWVQDAAAALPVRLLGDIAGKQVLDICAAPGGKTMQLASRGAKVTALDVSEGRLERLRANLERTRLTAKIVTHDALSWEAKTPFDAILLDAPCSATGTIRRHPDLPFIKAGADMSDLFELQAALIDKAVSFLKPGGEMIYCICSLLPREGETQAIRALERNACLQVADIDASALGIDPDWKTAEGGLRLRPDYFAEFGGMDGFYMVRLQKTG